MIRLLSSKNNTLKSSLFHINNVSPTIKFTIELEENNTLAMLDTLIHRRDDGSLKITISRKPTHTDQYLLMDSHHPLQHKLGVIRTLTHRAKTLITEEEDKVDELERIQSVLGVCGYKRSHFAIASSHNKPIRQQNNGSTVANKGSVTLPYVRGVSEGLRRILSKRGIRVHFKPRNTIRQHLVSAKDKIDKKERSATPYTTSRADSAPPLTSASLNAPLGPEPPNIEPVIPPRSSNMPSAQDTLFPPIKSKS